MPNRIRAIFDERNINVAAFSRDNGIKATALYSILDGKTSFDKIGISTFLKIAHGLGMTAEELYCGKHPESPAFADPRQTALNTYYEKMNHLGRERLVDEAEMLANRRDFAKSEDHKVSRTA